MGITQSITNSEILTVVSPQGQRNDEHGLTPGDLETLQEVERQLSNLSNCLQGFQTGAGAATPRGVGGSVACSSASTSQVEAAARAAWWLEAAYPTGRSGNELRGSRLQHTGSDEIPRLAAAGRGADNVGNVGGVCRSAGGVNNMITGGVAGALGAIDWLGITSYMTAGQTPQAAIETLNLSSALQADIRAYRQWLRRREEEAARQQVRLHQEMAAVALAARAPMERLDRSKVSNTRLAFTLESQLAAAARGVETLALRVEAVAGDLARLGEELGPQEGQGEGHQMEGQGQELMSENL
ncbi:hypothetical protein Vafri_12674 [Volvox africanus]|uniref:Uncharacterized protein n=1 Tax=Volvox africanus TaxID=51714 RepID=A0A8J4BAZ3_9CHLO|nr:hypothetical protein Vafri_12674 [Volvox africanus]